MNPKWIIFLIITWIVLAMLGGVIDGAFVGTGKIDPETGKTTEEATLNTLMSFKVFNDWSVAGLFTVPVPNTNFFKALVKLLTFDCAMFSGTYEIFRWLLFLPIAIAIGVSFMLALVRGAGSS